MERRLPQGVYTSAVDSGNLDDSRPAASMEATGAKLFRGEGKLTDLRTFPAFNRVLGESLNQLATKVATKGERHERYASQH
jgi:hypothetical protein